MNVLLWHVHGSWTTAMVQGPHTYLLPTLPERGPGGEGRARTWDWPASAVEVTPIEAREADIDVVIVQRPQELAEEVWRWTGRRPGRDLPTVYLEHDTPPDAVGRVRHPAADRSDLTVVHVTHFNDVMWDTGSTPTVVVEHGIVDPGYRFAGDLPRAAFVANEPVRRWRTMGTDLLPRFREVVPVDAFGMVSEAIGGQDVSQHELHDLLARRRVYLHPVRWTSLGLSLLEAMHLGLPVVALAATEVIEAVPPGAGVVSTDVDRLVAAARRYVQDPDEARETGRAARAAALGRYGLGRFLADWDRVLDAAVADHRRQPASKAAAGTGHLSRGESR
ncbi:MAG TPA: glycosyltransferase [Acidimicrobiales bacterium]|nr:glycosyltransferase [Acidimicrobiales bacterium]